MSIIQRTNFSAYKNKYWRGVARIAVGNVPDISPGTYTVHMWQEVLGEQTAQVTVIAGNPVTLDFKYHPKASVEKSH